MEKNLKRKNENVKPSNAMGERRAGKSNFKRWLLIFISAIGVGVIGWLAFMLFGNNYKSNAMDMKVNATVASRLAGVMLNDFQDNWIRVETEKLGRNADDVVVSTSDAKQVIGWRQEFFKKNGVADALDKVVADIEENYAGMGLVPAKYRDTKEAFKKLLDTVKALANLTKQPGDSLVDMAAKATELQKGIMDNIEATDFNFLISYEDVNAKIEAVSAGIPNKTIAEALSKEVDNKANGVINMLKYKKMGFKELPKGKGVLYKVVTEGKGPKPKDDTMVKLHYEGKLMDGTVFDSSYQRGEPVTMRPSQTVPGFWHSLTNMPVGSKWEIYIPYEQAYGARAAGAVKPYSDLFFTIETISIEK